MADPIRVTKCSTENTELQLPSHVSIVGGLDDYIQTKLDVFNTTTIANRISALSNVYLGKTATAVKATADANGLNIASNYVKKTDTIANASHAVNADKADEATNDSQGNSIINTYARKSGSEPNLKAGSATTADKATSAVYDDWTGSDGPRKIQQYFIGAGATGSRLTLKRGTGAEVSIDMPDTTYQNATTSKAGLMSTVDKTKLDGIETNAQNFVAKIYYPADGPYFGNAANITDQGVYVLQDAAHWIGIPKACTSTTFLLVFDMGFTDPKTVNQWLFNEHNNIANLWFRAINNGTPKGWHVYSSTPVEERTSV